MPTASLQRGKTSPIRVLDMTLNCIWWLGSSSGALGNVVYSFTAITSRFTPMGLWHTHGSPNLSQKTRPNNNSQQKKKEKICKIADFAVTANHRIKKHMKRRIITLTLLGKNYWTCRWQLNQLWLVLSVQ